MFEVDLGDMLDEVEADGGTSSSELWEDGRYKLEITRTNVGKTQKGMPKLGILWKSLDGPNSGATKWENLTINKESKTSKSIFINKLLALGLSKEFLKTSPGLEQVAEMLTGVVASVDVSTETWKSDSTKKSQKFKVVKLINTDDPAGDDPATDDLYGDME